jgi:hypothetical protein
MSGCTTWVFLVVNFFLYGGPRLVAEEFVEDVVSPGGLFALGVVVAAVLWLRWRRREDHDITLSEWRARMDRLEDK